MQTAEGYYYTDTLGETSTDPVILIHGVGGSHLSWPTSIRKIEGRRVICMDLPGHGNSAGSACQSVAAYTGSIESVLKAARIYRAIFVGYSFGGQVALHYCINHPSQCAGLGLIACSSSPNVPARLLELLNDVVAVERGQHAYRDGDEEPEPRQAVALGKQLRWVELLPGVAWSGCAVAGGCFTRLCFGVFHVVSSSGLWFWR